MTDKKSRPALLDPVASNGLRDRRLFLTRAAALVGGAGLGLTVCAPPGRILSGSQTGR